MISRDLLMQIFFHKNDLPNDVSFKGSVAIDTETMGLEVHRDRLCLVQLSGGDGVCHLVKIEPGQEKPVNLVNVLSDPQLVKIFHFARFDVAVLYKAFGVVTGPIFCTKIASKLVRTFTDRHGLKELCKEIVKVEISKQEQTSDWGAAEYTEEQKKYAATDVLHLHKIKDHFEIVLKRENRMDLAQAAFDYLPYRCVMDVMAGQSYDILSY